MLVIPYAEEQLQKYTLPFSENEEQKCSTTIALIKEALSRAGYSFSTETQINPKSIFEGYAAEFKGAEHDIHILVQGSYSNNTCVRGESDVDIAVIVEEPFIGKYPLGLSGKDYGFSTNDTFSILDFKSSLIKTFNEQLRVNVTSKNKSILLSGNSNMKQADIVPCYRLRDYYVYNSRDREKYVKGIAIKPSYGGNYIYNYPELHQVYDIEKNRLTDKWYKKMVRVFKNIAYDLKDQHIFGKELNSFVIECLLYNVPNFKYKNDLYSYSSIRERVQAICDWLINNEDKFSTFKEVNGINYLFSPSSGRNVSVFQNFIYKVKERL